MCKYLCVRAILFDVGAALVCVCVRVQLFDVCVYVYFFGCDCVPVYLCVDVLFYVCF